MYLLFLKEVTLDYFFLAIFFAVMPDLDIFLAPLRRIIKSKYLEHRGGSHSYIIGIIVSFFYSLISSSLTPRPFFLVWIIGISFYSLHVSMDMLTTTKIPYLFPLSKKEHSFYVEKAGSFFTFVNSIILLILPAFLFRLFAEIFFIQLYINIYTYFFIIYYCYRIMSKIFVSRTLDDNQKYFPGILPFYFKIYNYSINGNEVISRIEKKHYYFAKWTSFPIFLRKEGIFSIRFFFLETMMHRRNMFIQYDFDIDTQTLIGTNQGSGRIQSN